MPEHNISKIKIMGVLNVTPDSFSDGGKYTNPEAAITAAKEMLDSGADIIDIGAESTAPGRKQISSNEELCRLTPLIKDISQITTVSIDTFKSETARTCLELGAKMINDVSGLRYSSDMAKTIADFNAKVVIMYSKEEGSSPHASNKEAAYKNLIEEISDFLLKQAELALSAGIKQSDITLDPGMGGFISSEADLSWELIKSFDRLTEKLSPFNVAIATSRKGFLGGNVSERDPASALTALAAVQKGATLVRTHNVKMMREFLEINSKVY